MIDHVTRKSWIQSAVLDTAVATTPAIDCEQMNTGIIFIPATGITSLAFYVGSSKSADANFLPLYDDTGSAVTRTVTGGKAYALPAALVGAPVMKIVVNQAASVVILLKS